MLHILWMLIKFILIVLGILLGLVLLAILLLLFDPVRYRAQLQKEAEGPEAVSAKARVSWLFGLIALRASYADGQPAISVRIFGIPLEKLKGLLNRKKDSSSRSVSAEKEKKKKTKAARKKSLPERSPAREERSQDKRPPEAAAPGECENTEDSALYEEASSGTGLFSRIWGILKTILGLPLRAVKFLLALPGKIAAVIRKIWVTIQNICAKISWWREFLEDEHTRAVLLLVKQQAGGLIRHILPTKVGGEVTFGCEDPSLTGRILAVLGMSFPFHKNRIAVKPLFDGENHLTGQVFLKGRIYGIVILIAALKIYFNENTKYVISGWKSKA